MNCEQAIDLIGPYVDDDLPAQTRLMVEEHLLRCRDCAWDAQSLRITRDRLRGDTPEVVASDAFRARSLALILEDNPHITAEEAPPIDPAQVPLPIRL